MLRMLGIYFTLAGLVKMVLVFIFIKSQNKKYASGGLSRGKSYGLSLGKSDVTSTSTITSTKIIYKEKCKKKDSPFYSCHSGVNLCTSYSMAWEEKPIRRAVKYEQ